VDTAQDHQTIKGTAVKFIKPIISFAMAKFGPALVLAFVACCMTFAQNVRTNYMPGTDFSPLWVDGNMVVPKGADVYGRLDESKETGTFAGRSQLKLQLTGIVVNGQTVPLVTGEYEVSGKSKGESTAKRTVGGAAIGTLIGALAGGGKGAAIGAGTGAGVGAASEIITKGDQLKIPSETLLDFTLQQSVTIPKHAA
jgi:hypothetical protein